MIRHGLNLADLWAAVDYGAPMLALTVAVTVTAWRRRRNNGPTSYPPRHRDGDQWTTPDPSYSYRPTSAPRTGADSSDSSDAPERGQLSPSAGQPPTAGQPATGAPVTTSAAPSDGERKITDVTERP